MCRADRAAGRVEQILVRPNCAIMEGNAESAAIDKRRQVARKRDRPWHVRERDNQACAIRRHRKLKVRRRDTSTKSKRVVTKIGALAVCDIVAIALVPCDGVVAKAE